MEKLLAQFNIQLILANLKLYSVQAIVFLAGLNGVYLMLAKSSPAAVEAIPAWIIMAMNIGGLLYGYIGRSVPQPEAVAKVQYLQKMQGL